MSVATRLKDSVPANTSFSACDTSDCLSKSFDEIGAGKEMDDLIRLEKLGRKDRSLVFCGKLLWNDSGECASGG